MLKIIAAREKKEVLMIQVEGVRDILTGLEADEEISNLEKEEVVIIEEIAEVIAVASS